MSVSLIALFAAVGLAAGPAMADPAPPTRDQIYRQLGVDAVTADYIVLVDTSGSMAASGRYSNVRRVLGSFLSGLAPSDYVALYTFDTAPQRRYAGTAANRAGILGALPAGPTPNGSTDIGSGIEQALNELNRAGAADIATVVLLTDGQQDAPASSAYRSIASPAWQTLKTRARSLKKTWLGAYALPLMAQTGAALLQRVIPSTVVLQPANGPALVKYLDQSKQAARLAKARSLLAGDLGKGVRVTWTATQTDPSAGTATLRADLSSLTQRVPITVSDLHVNASQGVTWTGSPPSAVILKPGQTRSFVLQVRRTPGFSAKLWPHQVSDSAPMSLAGRVGSPWASALAPDIALKVPGQINNSGNTQVAKQVGSWKAVGIAGGVLAVILLAFALALYLRAFPRLPRGAIGIYEVGGRGSDGFRRIDQIPVRGRRFEHTSQAADAVIEVRGRRVPASKFATKHIGLEATVARNDSRGTSRHTIRPGHGGLVSGFYLLHVRQGDDVPGRLRVSNGQDEIAEGSLWAMRESPDNGADAFDRAEVR
ncbi:VWA domain-containing protein [Kribbella sp. NBC_00382]|uniref:vWA domain-containing protein n=1 Tax=Kribbella sp. NBC_00382 TaxID=2975967 RepID=UPI002E1F07C4